MVDLINPISFHGPGACPIDHTNLIVADREIEVMQLNEDGSVSDLISNENRCVAICPMCGRKYEMMRFLGTYRPYSQFVADVLKAEIGNIADIRKIVSICNEHTSNGKYTISGNPLAITEPMEVL